MPTNSLVWGENPWIFLIGFTSITFNVSGCLRVAHFTFTRFLDSISCVSGLTMRSTSLLLSSCPKDQSYVDVYYPYHPITHHQFCLIMAYRQSLSQFGSSSHSPSIASAFRTMWLVSNILCIEQSGVMTQNARVH